MEYPIMGIVGRRGFGKTAFMTAIGYDSHLQGYQVFANYHLKFPHEQISLEELSELPAHVHDCVVLMDEFHTGADAYDFFTKRARSLTKFVTQLRKRRVTFLYTTQYIEQIAKRLRVQTDYIVMMRPNGRGVFTAYIRDPHLPYEEQIINAITEDLTPVFKLYDTNEIVTAEGLEPESGIIGAELDDEMIEIFNTQGT
jgi:molybdopterin-guanine dinucleotide biosynthesis protein